MRRVYLVGSSRTPFGSFEGALRQVTAPQLGAAAISNLIKKTNANAAKIDEVFFGNVLQAGLGQAPARQAALGAGLGAGTPCTTVNKVCASGMKATQIGFDTIKSGTNELVVTGGQESMSNVPFIMGRSAPKYGGDAIKDLINNDGLTDVYTGMHMGTCAEVIIKRGNISRTDQDAYATASYARARESWKVGAFNAEVDAVEIKLKNGVKVSMTRDEEFRNEPADIPSLRALFTADASTGSVTAGNTSKLADGACALLLASEEGMKQHNLSEPLAEVLGHADAAMESIDFTTAVVKAIDKLLAKQKLTAADIDQWEVNEAFASVVVCVEQAFDIDRAVMNPHGGAISLGHPFGASGARITSRLAHTLKPGQLGIAGICNGGGGAGAILLRGV